MLSGPASAGGGGGSHIPEPVADLHAPSSAPESVCPAPNVFSLALLMLIGKHARYRLNDPPLPSHDSRRMTVGRDVDDCGPIPRRWRRQEAGG